MSYVQHRRGIISLRICPGGECLHCTSITTKNEQYHPSPLSRHEWNPSTPQMVSLRRWQPRLECRWCNRGLAGIISLRAIDRTKELRCRTAVATMISYCANSYPGCTKGCSCRYCNTQIKGAGDVTAIYIS
jgi:hypothetical protein